MSRKLYASVTMLVVLSLLMASVSVVFAAGSARGTGFDPDAAKSPGKSSNGVYIVQMADAPVVAYEGGVPGLKATAPKKGQKIDPNSADVVNYVAYLTGKHAGALAKVGGGQKLYSYTYSFNGFAAKLSPEQAAKMASVEGVLAVSADELQTVDTSSTPAFLGYLILAGCGINWAVSAAPARASSSAWSTRASGPRA